MKKYIIGLGTLLMAVGFSSFTIVKNHAKSSQYGWFVFVGSNNINFGDPSDFSDAITESNYEFVGETEYLCAGTDNILCTIYATRKSEPSHEDEPIIVGNTLIAIELYLADAGPEKNSCLIKEIEE
jgi:hypothetical protein